MDRVAVFVDAGYLFAQGSVAVSGRKKSRSDLALDPEKALLAFKKCALLCAPSCKLLRVYWYDGVAGGLRPTPEQALLGHLDDVKLRLGVVNSSGEQKGVDSLIVTDLIELARLKSICDAVLLAGDEDLRIGVQIAQSHGVRVHLLGIEPSRGSQSRQLMQEADTTSEWNKGDVSDFLSARDKIIRPVIDVSDNSVAASSNVGQIYDGIDSRIVIEKSVADCVLRLTYTDLKSINAYWKSERGVPSQFDGEILRACRTALGRALDNREKKYMRACFQREVKSRASNP